jgi:S1-C subfamily serine protease
MRKALLFIVCAAIMAPQPSQAQELIESYQAYLSQRDHFNSNGQRLTSAAAIIRQDRANFHRFGIRDPGDENDNFFGDAGNRAALERMLERGRAAPEIISKIVQGTPLISVEIRRGSLGPFVTVTILETAGVVGSSQGSDKKGGSSGTGFLVTDKGHIITNDHVVDNCSNLSVVLAGSPVTSARVIARDKTNDLAILQSVLRATVVPPLRKFARVGESIFVYGFPLSGLLATSGNFTTGSITAISGLVDDSRMYQISAPVQPGNSGGPVLDKAGNVVGVIVSKLNALNIAAVTHDIPQNINFAIKTTILTNFLNSTGVVPTDKERSREMPPEAIADFAKIFTVQVLCN